MTVEPGVLLLLLCAYC